VAVEAHPRVLGVGLTPSLYRKLAFASALSLYLIIESGATVRLTGSGLGCESWPGCQEGALFPEKSYHSFIEFGNRVAALFPIVLSLATAAGSHFVRGLPGWARWTAWVAAVGTLLQAPLGLLTVRLDLDPLAVLSHFLLAIVVLGAAVVVAVEAARIDRGAGRRAVSLRVAQLGLVLAAVTLVVVVTGTFVTAAGPHAGDPDVVDRLGNIESAIWLHVRVTAVFGVLLLGLVWHLRRSPPALRRVAYLLLVLAATQAAIGEVQWRSALPWWLVLAHVALAGAIWAVTVWLVALFWRPTARTVET
jgi:heme a synthase